jgi:hypothetical protein
MQIYYDPTTGLYLSGTIAGTELADGAVTSAKILDGTIVHGDVATANKDGTAATPSMRTLGTGATQACAGNDSRVTGAAAAAQPAWTAPSLLNSWVNYSAAYSAAGYFKDTLGIVHIRGLVKSGTSGTAVMFTLPVGYRPEYQSIFPASMNPDVFSEIQITTGGNVFANPTGSTTWTCLDGITFRAA